MIFKIRIYVDAVINHMAGKGKNGTGDAGSTFDVDQLDFPGVPFTEEHFTPCDLCPSPDCIYLHSILFILDN